MKKIKEKVKKKVKLKVTRQHLDIEKQLCLLNQPYILEPRDIIKLDFDGITEKQLIKLIAERSWLIRFFNIKIESTKCFKTGHGFHVYIQTYKTFKNEDLNFIQLALGSDFMRECFYWKRIKFPVLKNKGWNILFNKKYYSDGTSMKEKELKRVSKKLDKLLKGGKLKNGIKSR